ncbi:probable disease resistance protein At4g27220 [Neltuma alba]|uniref:probable disease resistance protein At4g27220 n=1 Tax=Neltuma alba TaxID=207710 RepID=UPI0010A36C93|nr:probable disease resistance protein At4g27220 [Prosopis alba]
MLDEAGQIQADAKYREGVRVVGSSSVSDGENEDLKVINYVFECLSPEDRVFRSPLSYLSQEELATLRPGAFLDSLVIDIFAEMLTHVERKKKITPSNWYLPVTFSEAALKCSIGRFLDFVHRQKIRENHMSDLESCEKVFIPVHIGAKPNGGHFYLYIIHLKNEEIEIWDSLLNKFVAEPKRNEITKKVLLAMEKLFVKVAFTKFRSKMANDILLQPNEIDCGIFVVKFMEQSHNYVKRNSLFQFDSKKEREDLASKLLNSDLNQEKQSLHDKASQHYAQVEPQDGNKRLRIDRLNKYDRLEKGSSKGYILPTTDLIGEKFQSNIQDICKWIMDDEVSAIGIWGMGGSGKTALATHIHNNLILEASSDMKVIWVTVSQNSISHLQKVIAKSIELDISDEFDVKRISGKLLQAFKEMKKCVVVLDDAWDHFFLKEVGFPISGNRIKLILTTRIREVCQGMDCKEVIKVQSLCGQDDWALFEKHLGFHEEPSLVVKSIAQIVAWKCEGFPLAIVRIATTMKGKTEAREWSHMLEFLENLGNGQHEMDKWVFPILRSSYDFLNSKLQRFFLYCALSTNGIFGDNDANRLIRRFVYESIDETKKLRVQYNEGYNMLDKLKNHSMLDYYGSKWMISKFLRVLAIGIAEETCKIMGKAYKNLTKIPSDSQWKEDLQKVFLMGNKIQTIPNGTCLKCSQVSTLLLNCNVKLNHISDDFFNNMPAREILDLSETGIKCLPESLSNLKCLIALLLSGCKELSYVPSLIKLKRLISLDLSFTAITEPPGGLESLVNLRCLCLLPTEKLKMSASLLSKLIDLECLEVGWAHCSTDAIGQGTPVLENLEVTEAYFRDINVFNNFVSFLAHNCVTRSCRLTLGDAKYVVSRHYIHQSYDREYSVKKILIEDMVLGNEKVRLPGGNEMLVIKKCSPGKGNRSLCSVLSYGHSNNPSQTELLEISFCEDLECLYCCNCPFCSSSQLVGSLHLEDMEDLKYLVSPYANSLHQSTLFSHLTYLSIRLCNSMEALMTPKLLAHLQNLRTIDVNFCRKMKEIVGAEKDHSELEPTAGGGDLMDLVREHLPHPPITLPKLTSLKLRVMPQLDFVCRGLMLCPSLQTFSAINCQQLNQPLIAISNDRSGLLMEKTPTGYHWRSNTD